MTNLAIDDFVAQIFRAAHRTNIDSAVMVFALADVLAAVASSLDLSEPPEFRIPVERRIDTFVARVQERYPEIRQQMEVQRKKDMLMVRQ